MEHKYNKGSEWRKWDLHVHTPESIVHNYKSTNEIDIWEQYIRNIETLPSEVKVLGINDYLFIDGYRKILEYKQKGRMSNIDLFLPVIELRLAKFSGNKQFKRINFHVIFSDKISADIIQSQFLNGLSSKYKLDPSSNQKDWGGVIDRQNLEKLGRVIKSSIPSDKIGEYGNDLIEGFNNLNLEINDIETVLKNGSQYFKGKYFTAIGKTEWDAFCWDDGSIAEKKTIINKVDIVFTAAENIENYNRGKLKLSDSKVNSRLLDCSDAHNNIDSTDKDRLGNCFTWIKADTTFEGLKQIKYEFEERVRIQGQKPDEKIAYNVIEKIKFINTSNPQRFTDFEIGFSPNLNAIIGGKSSGKSLLLHLIANKLGNTKGDKDYGKVIGDTEIEIYYTDNPNPVKVGDKRIVEFLPQLYIVNIVNKHTDKKLFIDFIETLIRQSNEINEAFSKCQENISQFKEFLSQSVSSWVSIDSKLKESKKELATLGDKTVINSEIKNIEERITMLNQGANLSDAEQKEYDSLVSAHKEKRNYSVIIFQRY